MKPYVKKLIMIIVIAVAVAVLAIGTVVSLGNRMTEAKIFGSIEELYCLRAYVVDTPPAEDKNVAGLDVVERYCTEIKYGGEHYTIYAYVLADTDAAKTYFERETGKDSASMDSNFTESSNLLFKTEYVAFFENRIIYIEGTRYTQFSQLRDYLFENLSATIR